MTGPFQEGLSLRHFPLTVAVSKMFAMGRHGGVAKLLQPTG